MDASSRVSPLRQRMIDDMRMRKLSEKTQTHYLRWVQRFAAYRGRSPDTATVEDLRQHLVARRSHSGRSAGSTPPIVAVRALARGSTHETAGAARGA